MAAADARSDDADNTSPRAAQARAEEAQITAESLTNVLAAFLRASELLTQAVDFNDALEQLARLMVEEVADICIIDVLQRGTISRVAATHREPRLQRLVDELRDKYPPLEGGSHPVAQVLASQEPRWMPVMDDALLREMSQDDRQHEIVRALDFGSFVIVPVIAEADTVSALTVIRSREREPFDEGYVELLLDLAQRAAVPLQNARLFEELDAAESAQRDAVEQLRKFHLLTDLALAALPHDEFIEEVMLRLQRVLGADTVRVLLADADGTTLRGGGSIGLGDHSQWRDELPIGRGFAGHVAMTREPLVVRPKSVSIEFLSPALRTLEALAGVPLVVGNRLIGVLHVGSRRERGFFDDDLSLLLLAAERIAIAIDQNQRYEQERHKTLALQRSLLPDDLAPIPGCRVTARYWPADETVAVGGDFYDVFTLSEETTGILIGDVSGKGLEAAALTGLARHNVRAAARHTKTIVEPLSWLHEAMLDTPGPEYCTALYGTLQRVDGGVRFSFASGGHPLPLRVRHDGTVIRLGAPGTALGLIPNVRFAVTTEQLESGDLLVLYTDGVTDTREEPLDDAGVQALFASCVADDLEGIAANVARRLRAIRARQEDDIALLLIRVD
jgi:serine phosphatase RsbU (regulator of sigma subunit)